MSRHRELRRHVDALSELRSILGAMRTLALVELGKLARFSAAQREMVASIERAAADFFAFAATPAPLPTRATVVFGSERGFCGGFNESLVAGIDDEAPLWVVGRRLEARLSHERIKLALEGPTAAEEVPRIVTRLAAAIGDLGGAFTMVHHDPETNAIRRVDPLATITASRHPLGPFPPRRNLSTRALASALVESYLPAVLLDAAYSSFLAENRERLRHMEGALDRLDHQLDQQARRLNQIRQEEITEEIEVLLLGAGAMVSPSGG